MSNSTLRSIIVDHSNFSHLSVTASQLLGFIFLDSEFLSSDFRSVNFENCTFIRCRFRDCLWNEVSFENCTFVDCEFGSHPSFSTDLSISFSRSYLERVRFDSIFRDNLKKIECIENEEVEQVEVAAVVEVPPSPQEAPGHKKTNRFHWIEKSTG